MGRGTYVDTARRKQAGIKAKVSRGRVSQGGTGRQGEKGNVRSQFTSRIPFEKSKAVMERMERTARW